MAGKPALAADHDKIAEFGAARNAHLTGENAAAAENDVVPDLNQIINHRAGADHRIVARAAIDRRIGADIDIVAYDDLTMDELGLTLPHPRLFERAFVLLPLAEIAPDLVIGGRGVREAAAAIDTAGIERLPPRS
mgnify:CR=1 FL=1